MPDEAQATGPLVSVLLSTYNRRATLPKALASALAQTYRNLEVIVVRDGGEPVRDLVEAHADPRVVFIDRDENRGLAASLNEALGRARGTYVAYLGDDDCYYPHHVETLVRTLESRPDCGVAYTDLYKVHCRVREDGTRQVLGKAVTISRDFDRWFLCYFNLALHVALMHRRDLLERTGLYNERIRVLIDWDLTRRLGFYTDFVHVPEVTGEFWATVADSDRISVRMRQSEGAFLTNTLSIRTTRPPKPWPKMPDLSVVLLADRLDAAAVAALQNVYRWTFMPYEVYLPLPRADLGRLQADLPNLVPVPMADGADVGARLDAALEAVQGDAVAVVPLTVTFGALWVEDPMYAALHAAGGPTAFTMPGHSAVHPAVVAAREVLTDARRKAAGGPLLESLEAAGVAVREPRGPERALQFDMVLQEGWGFQSRGEHARAAWLFRKATDHFGENTVWLRELEADALYRAGGRDGDALQIVRHLNRTRPTVKTLLLEGRLQKRAGRPREAVGVLERAEAVLAGKEPPCS